MIIAKLNYLRIAPRKVRLLADLVRGKSVEEAQTILNFTIKKAAKPLTKLLNSAISNAKNNFQQDPSNLYISKITVDEGPKYKRWRPRARGQASEIQKKTSHITIVLDKIKEEIRKQKVKKKGKKIKKVGIKEVEKALKKRKLKFKPEIKRQKPKTERGLQPALRPARGGPLKRIFRRKAF